MREQCNHNLSGVRVRGRLACAAAALSVFSAGSLVQAAVWTGGEAGAWLDPDNWTPAGVPNGVGHTAIIDNLAQGTQSSNVTLTLANATDALTTLQVDSLTIDADDQLTARIGRGGQSGSMTIGTLANAGVLDLNVAASGNSGTGTITVTTAFSNAPGATVNIVNTSGSNRRSTILNVPAGSQNDGDMLVRVTNNDRNSARLQLTGTGTFINNGTITLLHSNTGGSTSSAQFSIDDNVTLDGTGQLILDASRDDSAQVFSRVDPKKLTNGVNHTISGSGIIGAGDSNPHDSGNAYASSTMDLVNHGLIAATGESVALRLLPDTTVINSPTGRLVASGAAGMVIGSDTAERTFTNEGLLEARSGSSITFGDATVMTLQGQVRGGGIIDAPTLQLGGLATLAPGDSASANGTGDSLIGVLSVVGNLALADATSLALQLGAAGLAGIDYDTIVVEGDLTLDGILDIEALPGFGAGTYRLFSFTGTLIDQGLSLPDAPTSLSYQLSTGSSYIDLVVVPEPATLGLMGMMGAALLGRRRARLG